MIAERIRERFAQSGYIANPELATALELALALEKPLLIEGPAGVGKTDTAKVLADVLETRLIRLQCYEGLDASTALYEWNYPKQLLRIRLTEHEGATLEAREAQIFSEQFLLRRPLLEAITQEQAPVLLVDEVDRADEAFEAFLLELLGEFQVTIPEIGTIRAKQRPAVILTSNRSRELSDALRRRCLYLWLNYPSREQEIAILRARLPGIDARLAEQIARFMEFLREQPFQKVPGIAESLDWAQSAHAAASRRARRRRGRTDIGLYPQTAGRLGTARRAARTLCRAAPSRGRALGRGPLRDGLWSRNRARATRLAGRLRAGCIVTSAAELSANIVDFCASLRADLRFSVGHEQAREALRAAAIVGIADRERVRTALRLVLCSKPEELRLFDDAFDAFFTHQRRGVRQAGYAPRHSRPQPGVRSAGSGRDATAQAPQQEAAAQLEEGAKSSAAPARVRAIDEQPADAATTWQTMRARFSSESGSADPPPIAAKSVEALLTAASGLVAGVRLGRLRRWKPQQRGARFDMRRTLRASLQTGGDPVALRRLGHPLRNPRFVILLDGSRSMASHGTLMLSFAYALSRRTPRVNVFIFSTELREVTRALRSATRVREHQLAGIGEAWGGGTRIGASLSAFVVRYASRLLTPETVTIIYSDGLDAGDVERLERAMREIRRRSAAVIWVNPLVGTPGYAPSARGMSVALPYVDSLVGAGEATGLLDLIKHAAAATR